MPFDDKIDGRRRGILVFATAAALILPRGAIFASDGGGGIDAPTNSNTTEPISDTPPAKKSGKKTPKKKIRVVLTQEKYPRISKKGLQTALKGIAEGHDYWIEGFSKKMSRNIFEMTQLDRKRALRVFKEMRGKRGTKKRKKHLQIHLLDVTSKIEALSRSIRPRTAAEIFGNDNKKEIDKLREERKRCKRYRTLLRQWIKAPDEGTFPSG